MSIIEFNRTRFANYRILSVSRLEAIHSQQLAIELVSVSVRAVLSVVLVVGIANALHVHELKTEAPRIRLLSLHQPRLKGFIRNALFISTYWIENLAFAQVSRIAAVDDLNLVAFIAIAVFALEEIDPDRGGWWRFLSIMVAEELSHRNNVA